MTIALTDAATLRPLVLPARADAAPTALIEEYADVRNRSIMESSGRSDDCLSAAELLPVLYSSRSSEKRQWCIEEAGRMIGCAAADILQDSGGEQAIIVVCVLESHQRRGIGSAALAAVEEDLRAAGVRVLLGWIEHRGEADDMIAAPTGFGSVPRDAAARFAERAGFRLEQIERGSRLRFDTGTIAHLQQSLAGARERSADYRVVQWMLPTPPEFVDGYAWMKSRMSTDVPDADLDLPEEVWDAARVAELEQHQAAKGFALQVTAAQHIATGELCAFNELAIRSADPAGASHQYDTLVLSGHRGHRLGMLVKTAGLLRWHERYPESPHVITYNAEENRPMLDINEAIGFTPFVYEGAWRKELR